MRQDMCVPCGEGLINIRAGAVIVRNGKLLAVSNESMAHLYTPGGRLRMGETAREAAEREALEETGIRMKARRLGFVHENCFHTRDGRPVYEVGYYFYMDLPEGAEPAAMSFKDEGLENRLRWVSVGGDTALYPEFLMDELRSGESNEVKYFLTDER